ncbi:MAG: S-layer homology domain-containing protein, partial [Clostridia bacterium]|nr:S-layer homology domain-containing protein [Clostridia bacterium]
MIKTKKILAVLLCFILSIQCFAVVAETPSQTAQENSVYSEIAVKLGIFDSGIMGRLDSNITRGELVAAVMHIRGAVGDYSADFADVDAAHPYANEISAAYQSGYINGFGDGTFRPDEEATYAQLLKLLVYLAGYSELVESGLSVESVAVKAKISKYINLSASSSITMAQAAQILVDVGSEVEALDISGFVDGGNMYSSNGKTIFGAYLDVCKKDAIITANANTGIYEELDLGKDMLMLGTQKMKDSSGNASELIGHNVTAYVHQPKDGKPELLYALPNAENKITKISALNLDGFKDGIIYYEDEKGEDEEVAIKLSSVAVIYNGVLTKAPSPDDFDIETGSIELISNDGDKDIDVVKITKYENYVVDTYDKLSDTLWFKFGDKPINFANLENVEFLTPDQTPFEVNELAQWDAVSISKSKKDELVKVVYVPGEVEGKVSQKYSKDEKKIEVGGVTYDVAKVFSDNLYDEIYVGLSACFYFDIEGKIASYNLLGHTDKKFYYLIDIKAGSGLTPEPKIKLMDSDGNIKIIPLAQKLELDGVKKVLKNTSDMTELGNLTPQVFIGKLNNSGEISYIDTVAGSDSGLKVLKDNKEWQYKKSPMVFYQGTDQLAVSDKTLYMYVPQPGKSADDDDYYIKNVSSLANNSKITFTAYTDGEGIIADAIVQTHNPEYGFNFPDDHAPCVVNEVSKALNPEGEASYKISIFASAANNATYYTESESVLEGLLLNGKSYFPQKGDIIRISTNRYGRIRGIEPVYSVKSGELIDGNNPNYTDFSKVY